MFQQKQYNKYFHSLQKELWKDKKPKRKSLLMEGDKKPNRESLFMEGDKKPKRNFFNRKSLPMGWPKKIKNSYPQKGQQRSFLGQKGQGLIEYLILVALMGVATIGIMRTLNQTVKSRFANAIYALQGRPQKASTHNMKKEEYQRSDLSNFMSGSASTDKKKRKKVIR